MSIYRFSEILNFNSPVHATSKGIEDIEKVLDTFHMESFNNIGVSYMDVEGQGKLKKALYYFQPKRLKVLFDLYNAKGKTVFFHYPFAKGKLFEKILKSNFINNNNVYLLVHDIDSLRSFDTCSVHEEVELLNKAAGIMLHNPSMEEILRKNGLLVRNIVDIDIFDYLVQPEKITKRISREFSRQVVYAGNLQKSEFINQLGTLNHHNLIFNIYGPFFNENLKKLPYIKYFGNLDPNDIVFNLQGSFGLVWDGPDITTCGGRYGKYLRYNNPFKTSLYIAAQMPVIVWKDSAIADFVVRNNIGFTVSSLEEIQTKLDDFTELQYKQILKNTIEMSYKVRSGFFTRKAVKELLYNRIQDMDQMRLG